MIGVVLLAGCAQQAMAPGAERLVTPSDQRAIADIVPAFSIEAAAGEQHVVAILNDRLETDRTLELTPTEHLFAVVGGGRVPLVEETYELPGYENPVFLATRYTTTLTTDARQVRIEFDRADGSIVTSTLNVPARFAIASPPPPNIKLGDTVAFSISPAPGAESWGYWEAWCDTNPNQLITDGNNDQVYVAPDGKGTSQIGGVRFGATNDCMAQLRIRLWALGDYDSAFGSRVGPVTSTHPMGLQDVEVGVHLWGY
ncbi:MAG: hypothetical protein JO257_08050 [Deltaproteobacteria bacterium]|nr:hypothetical protein [Deltaproteobacteria bacterium]